jgi:RNA polymerase sigma factor (TIGR02999 family)
MIDHARARMSQQRGAGAASVEIESQDLATPAEHDLLDVDAALDRLDAINPDLRELVELRIFAGMTLEELAQSSGRSLRTVNRDWQRARALLMTQMAQAVS